MKIVAYEAESKPSEERTSQGKSPRRRKGGARLREVRRVRYG